MRTGFGRGLRFAARHAIALLAIAIALGGTATASHLVVRASDIQKGAVRGKQIKKNAVKLKQLKVGNVARRFGSGLLGGQVEGLTIPAGQSGDEVRAPIGVSESVGEAFDVVAPRRMVIRDVTVDAAEPVVRRINLRIRADQNLGLVGCVIEVGETRCDSGNARLVVPRGREIDVWVGDLGPADVELPDNSYRFAYRVTP
ncbi:MAG TPA: hypothetical protein VK919_05865 [Solirubrobacterales bacterium]|nr:hypothetical protein [Solirubrobacterales bacterium]